MDKRSSRSVSVSMSGIGLLISLSWFERSESGELNIRSTYLEYPDGEIIQTVEKSLNILAGDWQRFFIQASRMHAISRIPERDTELFDMIADAEQPEQAFISRYVLEYCGGKSAYDRLAEQRIDYVMSLRFANQAV